MTAISSRELSSQELSGLWKMPLFSISLVLAWILFLYWPTASSLAGIWKRSDTFAHGFLVPPLVLWLIWRQRANLTELCPVPSRPALAWLALAGLLWLAGELAAARVLSQLALVGFAAACVPALLGWRVARQLAFPLAFLLFAVPLGEFMIPSLMDWTARFTVLGLRLSGVPVFQEGRDFVIPSGTWSVVEACSGIRYLIASLMVGTLFAYLNFHSPQRRLVFIGVSLAVPIVANWARAYLIVMIGHLSGNELATGADHLIYGWLFFGLVIMLMFFIGSRWSETGPAEPQGQEQGASPPAARGPDWAGAALAGLVAALPVLAVNAMAGFGHSGPVVLDHGLEMSTMQGWRPVAGAGMDWRPAFREPSAVWRQTFERDGRRVGIYVAYYRNQTPDRKLISSTQALVRADDREWVLNPLGRRPAGADPREVEVAELRPRVPGNPALAAWHWYWAGGHTTASARSALAHTAWSRLLGRGDDAAVIVLYAPAGQAGEGEAALEDFVRSAGGAISHLLDNARRQP